MQRGRCPRTAPDSQSVCPGEIWHARYRQCVDFLVRMHSEGTLSEGQIAKVTGLDRVTIRKLADQSPHTNGEQP